MVNIDLIQSQAYPFKFKRSATVSTGADALLSRCCTSTDELEPTVCWRVKAFAHAHLWVQDSYFGRRRLRQQHRTRRRRRQRSCFAARSSFGSLQHSPLFANCGERRLARRAHCRRSRGRARPPRERAEAARRLRSLRRALRWRRSEHAGDGRWRDTCAPPSSPALCLH